MNEQSSISGTVTTNNGEPLPGAVMTLVSDVLPEPRERVTNAEGQYIFEMIPPGTYEVTAAMTGMNTAKEQTRVGLGQHTKLDFVLYPSSTR